MPRSASIPAFILFAICATASAQETVIYTFSENGNVADGRHPTGLINFDHSGNLFGVTLNGGLFDPQSYCQAETGCGTAYELTPSASGWTETVIYNFCPSGQRLTKSTCPEGLFPTGGLISDDAGNLFGTTQLGGGENDPGVIFELSPPASGGNSWIETVIHTFGSIGDGYSSVSSLTWGKSGKLCGTTALGGKYGGGVVFELSPGSSGGWMETRLHSFGAGNDGFSPLSNVIFDSSGNLYGTTYRGGTARAGTIFELTRQPGDSWAETVLYNFDGTTASSPSGNVAFGPNDALYGTFLSGGLNGGCDPYDTCGGVFEYSASETRLFLFDGADGGGPNQGVTIDDKSGVVVGTTSYGVTSYGSVFDIRQGHISPLYNFCSSPNCTDGTFPDGPLVARGGKLYGVAAGGGNPCNYDGVVFEITPSLPGAP
jgi:uncharacterized repeat protein (TIGR03803 family)